MPHAAITTAALLLADQGTEDLVLVTVVFGGILAFVGAVAVVCFFNLRRR